MPVLSLFALLSTLVIVFRGFRRLRGTTLVTAAGWAMAGLTLAAAAALLEVNTGGERRSLSDFTWYAAAVLLLCPGIAVLGARRPGAAAWSWFVLLPLVLVLMWPAVAATNLQNSGAPLELETPALIGFSVVLIMAGGNYFGTRYTLPSLLAAAAILLFAGPLSPAAAALLPDAGSSRLTGSVLLFAAALIALGRSCLPAPQPECLAARPDALWFRFVDTFGMVWAKRVMDRLNQSAMHERWSGRLELHGFIWHPESSDTDRLRTEERYERTLCWLLKRFVTPQWIERVLPAPPATSLPEKQPG